MEKNKYKYWVDLIKAGKIKISTNCLSMKDCLIDVFGEEIYKTICWMIENNIQNYVKPNKK